MTPLEITALIGYLMLPVSLAATWLAGSKRLGYWGCVLVLQATFIYTNLILGLYGFVIMNLISMVLSIRGFRKWRADARAESAA